MNFMKKFHISDFFLLNLLSIQPEQELKRLIEMHNIQ